MFNFSYAALKKALYRTSMCFIWHVDQASYSELELQIALNDTLTHHQLTLLEQHVVAPCPPASQSLIQPASPLLPPHGAGHPSTALALSLAAAPGIACHRISE